MRSFKKALCSVLGTLLLLIFISTIVIVPYMNSEYGYYQDKNLRNELSGQIDCIVLGASQALAGIDTAILDKELGCNSYNLSGSMMTLDNKYYLLSKELDRNPVETVILEISHDSLLREETSEFAIGDEPTIARLDSFSERIEYMIKYVHLNDWLNVYSREFIMGLDYYKALLSHRSVKNVDYNAKGYKSRVPKDITLTNQEAKNKYNTEKISVNYFDENVEKLNGIIELCKKHNCKVVITVVPVANGLIWELDNLDSFNDWITSYAKDNNCELYDINLAKNRNALFFDDKSFNDSKHLSSTGAITTTELLSQAMLNPDSWIESSYTSYAEMKKESQYAYVHK